MRTLSYLAQRFDDASRILSKQSDFISEIFVMLKEKCPIVVVAALKILAVVARKGNIAKDIESGELVKRLKTLIKRRDFFVTPAAIAALCEFCRYSPELRAEAIRRDTLVTLIDLFEFDKQGLSGGPRGLILLAEFEDIRDKLAQSLHIKKLVAFSRDDAVEKSKEATEELKELSGYRELRERIIAEGGLDSIVDNLAKPDHALFAADALLTLMKYDDAKERILNTKVDLRLLQMIDERIFDGTIHRKGIDILADIFKNGLAIRIPAVYAVLTSCADDLRSLMLNPDNPPSFENGSWNFGCKDAPHQRLKKAAKYVLEKTLRTQVKNAVDDSDRPKYATNVIRILRKMIETYPLDSVQNSAINYLRIIADYEDARRAMAGAEIIGPLLWCLKATDVDIEALNDVLRKIAPDESLRREITKDDKILVEMLSSHYPGEVLRMTAALGSLSSYGKRSPDSEI
ncbi:ARM repeat-containing protein [Suillus hirtellus]|nr:ARM repeat-containing protein [Suillus hirtellus]